MGGPTWDVAVVGAGMGGGTLGHALAAKGHRVVFVERGASAFEPAVRELGAAHEQDCEQRIADGHWPHPITTRVDGRTRRFHAPLGCGVGGSTLLYAAALERFERSDLLIQVPGDHSPTSWPITYDDLLPHYVAAETLYRVRGSADPLGTDECAHLLPPAAINGCDSALAGSLADCGLHPYRLHLGIEEQSGCTHCPGTICPQPCKCDARRIAVAPALATGRCEVMSHCEVLRVQADGRSAHSLLCITGGVQREVSARVIVLAAGAYHSPKLLLASTSPQWPRGLGNAQDQVGRNIMFHGMDMLALWPRRRQVHATPSKTIGLRDFYRVDGVPMGLLQSMGASANYPNVLHAMRQRLVRSRFGRNPLLWQLARLPALALSHAFGSAAVFATILQDLPYAANRVVLDADEPDGLRVEYTVSDELRGRWRQMRQAISSRLKPHRAMFMNAELELNFGHPCGSCRMGHEPRTSVLDASNRVHGMSNLYVVDASFMPTSGGANPALTVAANALRVAGLIDARLGTSTGAAQAGAGMAPY